MRFAMLALAWLCAVYLSAAPLHAQLETEAVDTTSVPAGSDDLHDSGIAPDAAGGAGAAGAVPGQRAAAPQMELMQLLEDGGAIGYVIIGLSVCFLALVIEHLMSVRRGTLMPGGLSEEVHRLIGLGHFRQADQLCREHPSFLSHVLSAGLAEVNLGYAAVEKAMEDASAQHAARLYRRLEYFTVIGTIAPMLGLLGTVWGMILAFMEFETKANPQVSELAPGIYKALITTLQGLCVAIPALAAFSLLRNRVDELVAQTTLMAEHVFANYKRASVLQRQEARRARSAKPARTGKAPGTAAHAPGSEATGGAHPGKPA